MKLLIVDDQKAVVDGLLTQVDWKKAGIDEAIGAGSAAEARRILMEQQIGVLLCDIEMPVETGLSLVKWMREQDMQTKCIFLTAHAKFTYAQQSVGLNAFDYVLQPAPYAEIRSAVERAVQSLEDEKHQVYVRRYDQVADWKNKQEIAAVLLQYLSAGDSRVLRPYVRRDKLPGPDQSVCLIHIQIQRWSSFESWTDELLMIMMDNAVGEVCTRNNQNYVAFMLDRERFGLLLWEPGASLERERVTHQLSFLYNVCRRELGCTVSLYPTVPLTIPELPSAWRQLLQGRENDPAAQTGAPSASTEGSDSRKHDGGVEEKLRELLQSDCVEAIEAEIQETVSQLRDDGLTEEQSVGKAYTMLLAAVRAINGNTDTFWREILVDVASYDIYRDATRSIADLLALARLVHGHYAQKTQTQEPVQEQDVVNAVLRYIDYHLEDDIHRGDLAAQVHLNPDYLNRLFKKQTGKTLKEFIIDHKMNEARKMLQVTRLPVSIIAAKVGYDNFSHFSYTYKKVIGQSPLESRNAR